MKMSQFRLKKLEIRSFRHVAPGARLIFHSRRNVLLGKNATGKTTLLSLVAAIVSSVFVEYAGEPFDLSYELVTPHARLKASLKNSIPSLPTPSDSTPNELKHRERRLVATGQFTLSSADDMDPVEVTCENGRSSAQYGANRFDGPPFDMSLPVWAQSIFVDVARNEAIAMRLYDLMHPVPRFDESLEYFDKVTKGNAVTLVRFATGMVAPTRDATLSDRFLLALHTALSEGTDGPLIRLDVPYLHAIARQLGYKDASMTIELLERTPDAEGEQLKLDAPRFLFRGTDGSSRAPALFSFGQKRLFAFLWYLECTKDVVIADELVNGLHHEWIKTCLSKSAGRQWFLASQNPLLLDRIPLKSAEDAGRTFLVCSCDAHGRMHWKHPGPVVAGELYRSFSAGFQQLHELLQLQGLW